MDVKKPIKFEEQLEKLIQHGCVVSDKEYALNILKQVNYYRLTAYFLPFKAKDGRFVEDTIFENVFRIYEFDRKLRRLLLTVIEEIELMMRAQFSYYHAQKYGALGYLDRKNFNENLHNHEKFINHIEKSVERNKNQPFVKHHIDKYDGQFPLWVIIELFSLGELSLFYSDMAVADKKVIAKDLFNSTYSNVSTWLRCLTDLRNYCAHYSRLYFSLFPAIPPTPKGFSYKLGKRIFDYILVLKFLYNNPSKWKNSFVIELETLLDEYSDCIKLSHIGFPKEWKGIITKPNPTMPNVKNK